MKVRNFWNTSILSLVAGAMCMFSGCSSDDDDKPAPPDPEKKEYFNIILGVGNDGNDGVFAQAFEDVSQGTISFIGKGYKIPADRTARVYSSEDGKYIYSLDYGGGTVSKFKTNGGQDYSSINQINVKPSVGQHPRWGKISEEAMLLHNIEASVHKYKDEGKTEYDYTPALAQLTQVKLGKNDEGLAMGTIQETEIPRSAEDIEKNTHIWRIDAPLVHKGKVYYGVAKRIYNPETGKTDSSIEYSTTTLVADYPSLTNLKTISSGICSGENYGYRTPTGHVDEKGDIYQLVGNGRSAMMLKINNENYDDSYKFELTTALNLGYNVGALGWFYVGNGIGYVPFYNLEDGQSEEVSSWGIARVDVYNKTAIKMNIPYKLWLRQYQKGALKDGKFYMALTPVGADGAIYIFDPTSTSADGFTKGAVLDNQADQFFIGIF